MAKANSKSIKSRALNAKVAETVTASLRAANKQLDGIAESVERLANACPLAQLAAEYSKIEGTENETTLTTLEADDSGIPPIDSLSLRKKAVEAMAAVLPAQSIEGVIFQLGLLHELFRVQCGWQAREKADEAKRPSMAEAHVRAYRMLYSIRNFLWAEYGLRTPTISEAQWLLSSHDDPFVEEANLWADVEKCRRAETAAAAATDGDAA